MKNKATFNLQASNQRKEFWYHVCQEWLDSGLTKTKFCAKRKVSKSALYNWLPHFKGRLNVNQTQTRQQPIWSRNN